MFPAPLASSYAKKRGDNIMCEHEERTQKTFFDKHFSTILPAVLTFVGISISLVQIYNQEIKLNYDRAQQFSVQNADRLSNLLEFMVLFPPSQDEKMQWISLGNTDREKKKTQKDRYNKAYELYGSPFVPIEFSELKIENPNVYSTSQPKKTTAKEEAEFFRSKFYDIVNSSNFSHTIAMIDVALSCIQSRKCDKIVMCGFLAPLGNDVLMSRHNATVKHWRSNQQHSGQIWLTGYLKSISEVCKSNK